MGRPTALVIEASRTQASVIGRQFAETGWNHIWCETVSLAFEAGPLSGRDLILADVETLDADASSAFAEVLVCAERAPVALMASGRREILKEQRFAGAAFALAKPFSVSDLGEVCRDAVALRATGRKRQRILVIDDSRVVRQVARLSLDGQGYKTLEADTFEAALEILAQEPTVEAVITDIFMPGMGGIKGIEALRRRSPGMPIVAMSGGFGDRMAGEDALAAAGKVGALARLTKPFTPEALIAVLEGVLRDQARRATGLSA